MKSIPEILPIFLLTFLPLIAPAQQYDLVSMDSHRSILGRFSIETATAGLLTDRPEADIEPAFVNEFQLAFAAADAEGQYDIIIYNFEKDKFTNLSQTDTLRERRPQLTDCGQYISAITEEPDGQKRLWLYPTNFEIPHILYHDIPEVKDYTWYDDNVGILQTAGKDPQLIRPISPGEAETLFAGETNLVQRRPKTHELSFIDATGTLRFVHLKTGKEGELGKLPSGADSYAWIDKTQLLAAKDNMLYTCKVSNMQWREIGSIAIPNYNTISHIAIHPQGKKVVLVMEKSEKL